MHNRTAARGQSRGRLERLAERLAAICIPRIRSQTGLRRPALARAAANGYLRAWANLAIREVAATAPLPGLTEAQWQEVIELAVEKVVEAESGSARAGAIPARRKAA